MIRFHQQLCRLPRTLIAWLDVTSVPDRSQYPVPEREEWLAEVRLDAPTLVVDIVVCGIVAGNMLKGIKWQSVSTMIIDSLDGRAGEEAHSLTWCHAGQLIPDTRANSVEKEPLKRMVIEGTVCVRNMEEVVARMKSSYRGLVGFGVL